jgi:hypothetical protein
MENMMNRIFNDLMKTKKYCAKHPEDMVMKKHYINACKKHVKEKKISYIQYHLLLEGMLATEKQPKTYKNVYMKM